MKKLNLALLAVFLTSSVNVQASLVDQEEVRPSLVGQVMEDVKMISNLLDQAHDHHAKGTATDREEIALETLASIKQSLLSSKTKGNFMVTLEKVKAIWAKEDEPTEGKGTWAKLKNRGEKIIKTDCLFKLFILKTVGYIGIDLTIHVGPKVAKLIIKELIESMTESA